MLNRGQALSTNVGRAAAAIANTRMMAVARFRFGMAVDTGEAIWKHSPRRDVVWSREAGHATTEMIIKQPQYTNGRGVIDSKRKAVRQAAPRFYVMNSQSTVEGGLC